MKTAAIIACLLPLAMSVPVSFFKACDSVGTINSLDVSPCEGMGLCKFPRGGNITLTVKFTMPNEVTAAKPVVYAHLGPLTVPQPFPMEADACSNFDSPCPLAANAVHTYTTVVPIRAIYPKIRVVPEWQLHNQDDQKVFCFAMPVEVVDP